MRLVLFDRDERKAAYLLRSFYDCFEVTVATGDFSTLMGDLVSPANCFGFMDGGIDDAYRLYFGNGLQNTVQHIIKSTYGGEMLVGQAFRVPLDNHPFTGVIIAPTMRVPGPIEDPNAVFMAARAAMRCATDNPLCMPCMGSGAGLMHPAHAARLMRRAYDEVTDPPPFPETWIEAWERQNEGRLN